MNLARTVASAFCLCLTVSGVTLDAPNPVQSGEWVLDTAELFDSSERTRIRKLLQRIHRQTDAQFVVVTVPNTGLTASPRAYAIELFTKWGLGTQKQNNGVLFLLTRESRAAEIVVGSGLTGILTAVKTRAILDRRLPPAETVKEVARILAGIEEPAAQPPRSAALIALPIAVVAWTAGIFGAVSTIRFRSAPAALPPVGRRRETRVYNLLKSEFVNRQGLHFFAHQADVIRPGYRMFPVAALWLAAIGLSAATAATATSALAAVPMNLEPSFWILSAVIVPLSAVTLVWFERTSGEASQLGRCLIPLSGLSFVYAVTARFLSDATAACILAPAFVLLANLAVGLLGTLHLRSAGRTPRAYVCADCAKPLSEIAQQDLGQALENWEPRARESNLAYFRGWRCATCHARLNPSGAYVAWAPAHDDVICARCQTPTVESVRIKGNMLQKTCFVCAAQRKQQLARKTQTGAASGNQPSSYDEREASASAGSSSTATSFDDNLHDPGAPGGGGTTDGDGASGTW